MNDLIIGRMDHICQKNSVSPSKVKKHRKTNLNFISMILNDDGEEKMKNEV
jgi:hypothetical protein